MYRLASTPSGVPWATLARKMSPVEILGAARCAAMNSAWVPLPAPGGPTSTNLTGPPARCCWCSELPGRALAQDPFVVALHELALDLLHRFQTDADDDEHSRATVGEVLLVAADHVDEQVRYHRDHSEVQGTGQGDPAEDGLQVLRGRLPRTDTGHEPAVLLHVVGHLSGIEGDRHVEVREEQDQQEEQQDVDVV